jgi:hypothetical protein
LLSLDTAAAQAVRECLLLLRTFIELWLSLLQEQRLNSSMLDPAAAAAAGGTTSSSGQKRDRPADASLQTAAGGSHDDALSLGAGGTRTAPDPASLVVDLHKLEAVLFMLLCSHDESMRCDAYAVLGLLRTLHTRLCLTAEQWGVQPGMPAASGHQQGQQQQQQQVTSPAGTTAIQGAGSGSVHASGAFSSDGVPGAALAGASASGVSGSGPALFSRHKPTTSRDSADFLQTLGTLCACVCDCNCSAGLQQGGIWGYTSADLTPALDTCCTTNTQTNTQTTQASWSHLTRVSCASWMSWTRLVMSEGSVHTTLTRTHTHHTNTHACTPQPHARTPQPHAHTAGR